MAPEIVDHEPHLALFAGADGLDVIRQMVAGLREWLAPGGLFATEIDPSEAGTVSRLLSEAGLSQGRVERDLAGPARFVAGEGDPWARSRSPAGSAPRAKAGDPGPRTRRAPRS